MNDKIDSFPDASWAVERMAKKLKWRLSPELMWPPAPMLKVRKCLLASPKISEEMLRSLESMPRANELTFPCSVTLKDGRGEPRVLFVENDVYLKHYAGCYGDDKDPCVDLREIARIQPSLHKMPPSVEKKMYAQGETHMGGFVVVLVLSDGTRYWHQSGDFLEFVCVPQGYQAEDVVDVIFPAHEDYQQQAAGKFSDHPRCEDLGWKWVFFQR